MNLNIIDYHIAMRLAAADIPFSALISAAMRKADSINASKLAESFPIIQKDLQQRYNARGGLLDSDGTIDPKHLHTIVMSYIKRVE